MSIRKFISQQIKPNISDTSSFEYWREKIFLSFHITLLLLGFLAYIPSTLLSVSEGLWHIVAITTTVYLWALYIFRNRKISYKSRVLNISAIIYIIGISMLIILGPVGAGPIWLFAYPVLTAILLGKEYGVYALIVNFCTFFLIASLDFFGLADMSMIIIHGLPAWIVNHFNFMFLNVLMTVSVGFLIDGLKSKIEEEKLIKEAIISKSKELESSEKKYKMLTDNLPLGVYQTDQNDLITFANPAFANMFNYKEQKEIINKTYLSDLLPKNAEKSYTGMNGDVSCVEYEFDDNYKKKYYRDTYKTLEITESIFQLDGIIEDITIHTEAREKIKTINKELELRVKMRTSELEQTLKELQAEIKIREKMEEQLIITKEELIEALEYEKELHEVKSKFIAMASHEYKTPLTVILSSAYLLEKFYETQNKPKFDSAISKIQVSVSNMNTLIEDILAIGKNQNIALSHKSREFELIDFCSTLVNEIRISDKYKHEIHFIHELDQMKVNSDPKALRSIISNLLSNASKYSNTSGVVVFELNIHDRGLQFVIKDTGIGISEEDQHMLFEPFFRSSKVSDRPGSGLGLSIVMQNVKLLNGEINVESELGKGSSFSVSLPVGSD